MNEQRLERMEGMLSQIINTIGNIMKEQTAMREENDRRHQEVLGRFKSLEADQDHIWEKTVRNERELAKFKNQFGS